MLPEPRRAFLDDAGMATDYALIVLVGAAFAAALYLIATSDWVQAALAAMVERALNLED